MLKQYVSVTPSGIVSQEPLQDCALNRQPDQPTQKDSIVSVESIQEVQQNQKGHNLLS